MISFRLESGRFHPGRLRRFACRSQASRHFLMVAAGLAAPLIGSASAQEASTVAPPEVLSAPLSLVPEEPRLFDTAPLGDAELAATKGREQNNWLDASATNSAIVANNHVGDNSTTGGVAVSDSAFQNVSGVAIINFNTGNNSSINAAMSVNLQINYASPGQ